MAKKTIRRIHLFRPGTHVSAAGKTIDFSEADVTRMAAVYDPARHEAPLVVGHPKDTAPAYGYVQSLTASEDGQIHALPHQVSSDFAELVETGAYKHVSASFYSPGTPTHPLAGQEGHDAYYLRHVAFLGAQPPAIKGLKPVEFAEGEEGVVEFSEMWNPAPGAFARLARRLREYFVAQKDVETADQIVPSWEVESLERAAAEHDVRQQLAWEKERSSDFAEVTDVPEGDAGGQTTDDGQGTGNTAPPVDDAATRLAEIERRERELAEREAAAEAAAEAERERLAAQAKAAAEAARNAAANDFAERILADGRELPRHKPVLTYIHQLVARDAAEATVEFGEGEDAVPALDAVEALFASRPKVVEFSEVSKAPVEGDDATVDVSDPHVLAAAASAWQGKQLAAGHHITVTQAIADVKSGRAL